MASEELPNPPTQTGRAAESGSAANPSTGFSPGAKYFKKWSARYIGARGGVWKLVSIKIVNLASGDQEVIEEWELLTSAKRQLDMDTS